MPGANQAVLQINKFMPWHAGSYKVRVTDENETVSSTAAQASLKVNQPEALWNSLLLFLPFSGSHADASASGRTIQPVNVGFTSGPLGDVMGAAAFSNSGIDFTPNLSDLSRTTFSAWIKTSSNLQQTIIADWDDAAGHDYHLALVNRGLMLKADKTPGSLYAHTDPIYELNEWFHLIWVVQPNLSKVFVNGVLVATVNQSGSNSGFKLRSNIGYFNYPGGNERFDGSMACLRVYGRSFSDAQAAELYLADKDGTPPSALPTAAPVIAIAPGDVELDEGDDLAIASTSLGGLPPFTYQWRRNQQPISGATSANLLIRNVKRSQAGSYDVVVRNAGGVGISNSKILRFPSLVEVQSVPVDTFIFPGDEATFTVDATNATFQWLKNGAVIRGARGNSFTVTSAGVEAAGSYSVVVTTAGGKVTTAEALLRVSDAGLLVYKMSGSGRAYEVKTSVSATVTGYLVLDRAGQRGGVIVGGKSGAQKVHRLELHEGLDSRSTGPVPGSQTVLSELVENELAMWFRGADGVLQITKTMKGLGPKSLSGFMHTLTPSDPLRVEELKLNLTLDAPQTGVARLAGETVEEAMARLSQELQKGGSALLE